MHPLLSNLTEPSPIIFSCLKYEARVPISYLLTTHSISSQSTCSATQTAISRSVDFIAHREDYWRRRLERESERRRTTERQLKGLQEVLASVRGGGVVVGGAPRPGLGIRMGPGKAHQRSHSHGGQQPLLFPQLHEGGGLLPPCADHPVLQQRKRQMSVIVDEAGGPDCAEGGPDYNISEEHFYDAIDAQIDKIHRELDNQY